MDARGVTARRAATRAVDLARSWAARGATEARADIADAADMVRVEVRVAERPTGRVARDGRSRAGRRGVRRPTCALAVCSGDDRR
jgi:hypothetical protein